MTGLIERLRSVDDQYCASAADAIEALQAENEQWKVDFNEMKIDHDALAAELATLEADAERYR